MFLSRQIVNTPMNPSFTELHYENMPMQYIAIFYGCKNDNFQMKIFVIFLIFASVRLF